MDVGGDVHAGDIVTEQSRTLTLTAERLRWYSRRGNFHSDQDAAAELGLTALVAQGMQVAGPAYGLLLDEWGDGWLTDGVLEVKFVGMVVADETVEARVEVAAGDATITVVGVDDGQTRVVGRAVRRGPAASY